jgi:hypothetical protein
MSDERATFHLELEYLDARERELKARLESKAAANAGTVQPVEAITMERVCALAEKMLAILRQAGTPALTTEWSTAFVDWRRAQEKLEMLITQLRPRADELTGDDMQSLDSARDRLDDAAEHFERVHAQVVAWFYEQAIGGEV